MKNNFCNNLPILNLYRKKIDRSPLDTQLLYGDNFKVLKRYGKWCKIKIIKDGYIGFIKNRKLTDAIKPNFKVSVLKAKIYKGPNNKKIEGFLPFGSRLKVIKKEGKFAKFNKYWIKSTDLKRNNYKKKNIFEKVKMFVNSSYLWGGKSYRGIDCSALIQVFFNYNNKYCPRDSKYQEKYFKKIIKLKNIKKNDMIFWKGHVAVALSKKKLIHAYGPMRKVVVMNTKKTIERIYKTANLKVTSIRRI